MSEVENSGVVEPENELSTPLSTEPFEVMTPDSIVEAADTLELELSELAVRLVVAPEPGP